MTTDWIYGRIDVHSRELESLRIRVRRLEQQRGKAPKIRDWVHLAMSLSLLIGMAATLVLVLRGEISGEQLVTILQSVAGSSGS